MELSPGTGILYQDPEFIDTEHWNFKLSEVSPCINSGNPNIYLDSDGSNSDIGSNPFIQENNCNNSGDLNDDGIINVLDVVDLVNCILFTGCSECSDLNDDGLYNVLDIIDIVNIIIS